VDHAESHGARGGKENDGRPPGFAPHPAGRQPQVRGGTPRTGCIGCWGAELEPQAERTTALDQRVPHECLSQALPEVGAHDASQPWIAGVPAF
jgi:hypothetical protein